MEFIGKFRDGLDDAIDEIIDCLASFLVIDFVSVVFSVVVAGCDHDTGDAVKLADGVGKFRSWMRIAESEDWDSHLIEDLS